MINSENTNNKKNRMDINEKTGQFPLQFIIYRVRDGLKFGILLYTSCQLANLAQL